MDANRKTAYYALLDVEAKKAYSNLALNHHIICGKPDSPAFVRELVYGVLENKLYLDYMIDQFVRTKAEKLKVKELTILRMGFYQLNYMDSVPSYAAVNESVALAKRFCKGKEGFVNGVLRNYLRDKDKVQLPDREEDPVRYLSLKYSYAPWIVSLWLDVYEDRFAEELLAAGNRTPDTVIRLNALKTDKESLTKRLSERGFTVTDGNLAANALHVKGSGLLESKLYKAGLFSVQDESSIIAVDLLDPQPEELIVDVCAAPGGKSLYIAEKMENKGRVLAGDIYKRKLNLLEQDAKRLGLTIIETGTWDATRVDSSKEDKADRVLVDAPCSGLGVISRKPEIKYKKYGEDMVLLPRKQLAILSASSKYVKKGGTLVYCTCTIVPEENQDVVAEFLKKNPEFEKEESMQLLPNINNTDGFYICKMRRK